MRTHIIKKDASSTMDTRMDQALPINVSTYRRNPQMFCYPQKDDDGNDITHCNFIKLQAMKIQGHSFIGTSYFSNKIL